MNPPRRQSRPLDAARLALSSIAIVVAIAAPATRAAAAPAGPPPASRPPAAVVIAWSQEAYEVGFAEDRFLTFKAHHATAMMHLAMHDAVNAVVPRYQRHAFHGTDPLAGSTPSAGSTASSGATASSGETTSAGAATSTEVAAAQAAHDVLAARYPDAGDRLDALLAQWRRIAAPEAAERAAALGRKAAAAVLAAGGGSGWDTPGSHAFRAAPGAYRATDPASSFVLQPGFRSARPFTLDRGDQLRPPPPPPLASREYAAAFAEVKSLGSAEGAARSADATGYAVWWMEFAEGSVTRLARRLAAERELGLAEGARLFALLAGSLFDAYVATWDAKYEYDTWRPSTAIHAAADDGNPATEPDAGWRALRPEPPFPEYTSAHAAGCAAAFAVLADAFGDEATFTMETITAPPGMPSRRFGSFGAAAEECADSRVQLGWHFRFATDAGLALGRAVAVWASTHHLRPLAPPAGPGHH